MIAWGTFQTILDGAAKSRLWVVTCFLHAGQHTNQGHNVLVISLFIHVFITALKMEHRLCPILLNYMYPILLVCFRNSLFISSLVVNINTHLLHGQGQVP